MRGIAEIAAALAWVEDPRLIAAFLRSILTKRELQEVDGRWELVKRLARGESQRAIARRLGMSLCKITRGSRELKRGPVGFAKIVEKGLQLERDGR